MKTKIPLLLALLLILVACEAKPLTYQTQTISSEQVSMKATVEFPSTWTEGEKGPFDMQWWSADKSTNSGFFLYRRSDFKEGAQLADMLGFHVDDIGSKRENFKELEAPKPFDHPKSKEIAGVYEGTRNGKTNVYRFAAIEFTDEPELVVVSLQVALPEEWPKSRATLERITASLALPGGAPSPAATP